MIAVLVFMILFFSPSASFSSPRLIFRTTDSHRLSERKVEQARMGDLTPREQTVYDFMKGMKESGYTFRAVVVGKGAILETTTPLGPVLKVTQSPSTGDNLLTLATTDQETEFHLRLSQVKKVVITKKETPSKTLRIVRLVNVDGEGMCSLILADQSEAATKWYDEMAIDCGDEIEMP